MRLLRRALPVLLLAGVLAACGSGSDDPAASGDPTSTTSSTAPTTSTTEAAPACAAAALSDNRTDDQPDLPDAVAATRAAIIEAALACDLERLEELSLAGDGAFNYSFGQPGPAGLADHLRTREADGEELTRILVETLRLPFQLRQIPDGDRYVSWDRADPLDYRVGITESGDWMYFVAGD